MRQKKNKKIFVLQHVHELPEGGEDVKLIGVYSTEAAGKKAASVLSTKPGFSDHLEGFSLSAYELDMTHWLDGFITVRPANQ